MDNPWLALPEQAPFVLDSDSQQIEDFNRTARPIHHISLDLLPEPYLGNPTTASVFLLSLNPGFSPNDYIFYADSARYRACLDNLFHAPADYPFYLLNPAYREYSGPAWWRRHLKWLIEATSAEQVANRVCCIEFFPYHSARFAAHGLRLASQEYSFQLVQSAIATNKPILILRAKEIWEQTLPALKTYSFYTLRNLQRVWVSPNNIINHGFDRLVEAIASAQ